MVLINKLLAENQILIYHLTQTLYMYCV